MLVPERMERKRWGKSLLNLLLKTKVWSCLLYWSTGTNRNSSPLRMFKWRFLGLCHICFLIRRSEGLSKVSNSRSVLSMLWDWAIFLNRVKVQHPQQSSYCCSASQSYWEHGNSVIDAPLVGCVIAIGKTLPQLWHVLASICQINFLALVWTRSFKSHLGDAGMPYLVVGYVLFQGERVWSYCWNTFPSALRIHQGHPWVWLFVASPQVLSSAVQTNPKPPAVSAASCRNDIKLKGWPNTFSHKCVVLWF